MVMEIGRLMFEVKLDTVKGDKKVLNNRLAISSGKDNSTKIDIVAWGKTAEVINTYFKKGYEILVSGTLINTMRKKENVDFETVAILVDKVQFTHGNPKAIEDVPDFLK